MQSAQPLISCIIPTKNRPQLVVRAVRSILTQTYANTEIIVVDDSTNDETRSILAQTGPKIRYIKNQVSKGAPYSRNIGIAEAKGDIIAFLDDDDQWMPAKLEVQARLLRRQPIVSCNYLTTINGKRHYIDRPDAVTFEQMLYYNYLGSCSCVAVSADIMQGCFFDEGLRLGQDWDMWLALMKKSGVAKALNAGEYLVDYNSGVHSRISNAVDPLPSLLAIYDKYRADHSGATTRLFSLYNLLPSQESLFAAIAKEILKAVYSGKNVLTVPVMLMKRILFRRTTMY